MQLIDDTQKWRIRIGYDWSVSRLINNNGIRDINRLYDKNILEHIVSISTCRVKNKKY